MIGHPNLHLVWCVSFLRVLGFNVKDYPIGGIVVVVYRVRPVLYPAKIICDGMLRTWPVLDVDVKFL